MFCTRYKKNCDEALYLNCDVPTSSTHIDEQIMECQECVFYEDRKEDLKMNKYESIIIVAPTIDEKQQKEIENKYSKLIKENGKLVEFKSLGKKMLAYEIKKNKYGLYFQINFESEASFIAELERQYRIDDNIIKFIVVKED